MALDALLEAFEALPAFRRLAGALPSPAYRQIVSGLAGSSDAVLVASLARTFSNRLFVVVTDGVPEAERWLADLEVLAGNDAAAFYPPREGFGEAEPHAEIAGERVETLERVSRGEVRILVTTARAILERTQLPRALRTSRNSCREGRRRETLRAVAAAP